MSSEKMRAELFKLWRTVQNETNAKRKAELLVTFKRERAKYLTVKNSGSD